MPYAPSIALMHDLATVSTVAHAIQLSVAPVFLLTSISGLLAVLANRTARVVDRARLLEQRLKDVAEDSEAIHDELATLQQRLALVSRSIALCTATALLICTVIATLFLGASLGFDTGWIVSVLFVVAMALMIVALIAFLREVLIAASTLRIGIRTSNGPQ